MIALEWWGIVSEITNHSPDPLGNKWGQGQSGSIQRELQENYTLRELHHRDRSQSGDPRPQEAVI